MHYSPLGRKRQLYNSDPSWARDVLPRISTHGHSHTKVHPRTSSPIGNKPPQPTRGLMVPKTYRPSQPGIVTLKLQYKHNIQPNQNLNKRKLGTTMLLFHYPPPLKRQEEQKKHMQNSQYWQTPNQPINYPNARDGW